MDFGNKRVSTSFDEEDFNSLNFLLLRLFANYRGVMTREDQLSVLTTTNALKNIQKKIDKDFKNKERYKELYRELPISENDLFEIEEGGAL